ncbi:BREX-1 system phosphatase PglZ type B [Porticoccus sp. GXU_MW_L64]
MSTVIEEFVRSIRNAATYNANSQVKPVVTLWTDKEQQWKSVLPVLQSVLPELLILGGYKPDHKAGPAIWLKCVLARKLDVALPDNKVPIIYLPGLSRSELRAVANCPDHIKPLAELQYRGAVWSQLNGKDWTINAFLTSGASGLGLDVAQDKATQEAIAPSLEQLLNHSVESLDGRRLEAEDFHRLISNDPVRDLLSWMNQPESTEEHFGAARWQALCNIAKTKFKLDIVRDGAFAAAEKLCEKEGEWQQVWNRFCESPGIYSALPELLERVPLPGLFADPDTYPQANANAERDLQASLESLAGKSCNEAKQIIQSLEASHGARRSSLWASLGKASWAMVLEPLADVVNATEFAINGLSAEELGQRYAEHGWKADAAAVRVLSLCENKQQLSIIENVLAAIYTPWLADTNERLQKLIKTKGYPGATEVKEAIANYQVGGEVVFFIDGLRLDVAHQLIDKLDRIGVSSNLATQWAAVPSVTATAKAAVSPVYEHIEGLDDDSDFEPSVKGEGGLTHDRFKRLLAKHNWQYLKDDETGDPAGNAWVACGDIDKEGHKTELKLAKAIAPILDSIVERIVDLQNAGWKKIRLVTDHGWLLVPGDMPKSTLPVQAADSRWGRCAQLKKNVEVEGLTLGWHWNPSVPIHFPYGIHSFIAGRAYGHGGLSLQECVVPVISINSKQPAVSSSAQISTAKWLGLTCKVKVETSTQNLRVDLRTKLADPGSSLVKVKSLDQDGKASLMVADDDQEGISAIIVILDEQDNVLCKQLTTIGGDD